MNSARRIILIVILSSAVSAGVCAGQESGGEGQGRVLQFPEDYSVGRVYFGDGDVPSWGRRYEATGNIKVPQGKSVKFYPYKIAWRRGWALSTLKPDDIHTLGFVWYKDADESVMEDIGRLTGLEDLALGYCDGIDTGLKYLTGLKKLRHLWIPKQMQGQDLVYLAELPSLESLAFGGPMVTDEKMAHIGKLTQLTELTLRGSEVAEGLVHLKGLKSLRLLDLKCNRSHDIDDGLRHIAGLTELEELNLRETAVSDVGLAHLSGLAKLKKLNLFMNKGGISDAGMAHLRGLKSLEELTFPCGLIGDIGLAHLAELDSLRNVRASEKTTDKGLAAIARMKSLRSADVAIGKKITDAGLAELYRCPHLESLGLSGDLLTDERLAKLAGIKTLKHLGIHRSPITGASLGEFKSLDTLTLDSTSNVTGDGLASLRKLSSLKGLEFCNVNPGKKGTSYLAGLTSLKRLEIWVSPDDMTFGDDDLAHLADLTSLRYIRITVGKDWSTITDRGLAHLSNLKALEHLTLGPCPKVTDAGLKHLEGLSRLNDLTLYKSRITMAGVAELKEKIPEMTVTAPCSMAQWNKKRKAIAAGRRFDK
jgi:Leucine-rich repeat (LRR) protein